MEWPAQLNKNAENIKCSNATLMKFFILKERSLFSIYSQTGVKLLTSVRLKFSRLNEFKFRRDFKNIEVLMYYYGKDTETTEHFFLSYPFFVTERQQLLNNLYERHLSLKRSNEKSVTDLISSINMKTNKFFIQLIISNLLDAFENI